MGTACLNTRRHFRFKIRDWKPLIDFLAFGTIFLAPETDRVANQQLIMLPF